MMVEPLPIADSARTLYIGIDFVPKLPLERGGLLAWLLDRIGSWKPHFSRNGIERAFAPVQETSASGSPYCANLSSWHGVRMEERTAGYLWYVTCDVNRFHSAVTRRFRGLAKVRQG